jgi:hypothetical protein
MNRILNSIDWMLQHHPLISVTLLLLAPGIADGLANVLVPPP